MTVSIANSGAWTYKETVLQNSTDAICRCTVPRVMLNFCRAVSCGVRGIQFFLFFIEQLEILPVSIPSGTGGNFVHGKATAIKMSYLVARKLQVVLGNGVRIEQSPFIRKTSHILNKFTSTEL